MKKAYFRFYAELNDFLPDRLLPQTLKNFEEFKICSNCLKIYWQGWHYKKMISFVEELNKNTNSASTDSE